MFVLIASLEFVVALFLVCWNEVCLKTKCKWLGSHLHLLANIIETQVLKCFNMIRMN